MVKVSTSLPPGVAFNRPATLIATWFGVGLLPWAPGTWGSLAALPLAWTAVAGLDPFAFPVVIALLFAAGWWASAEVVERDGGADPSYIVVDEVVGQLIALSVVPADPLYYALAFLGFRFFDIVKPWPISWADRSVKGGLGVMLDDVFAGLAVAIVFVVYLYFVAG